MSDRRKYSFSEENKYRDKRKRHSSSGHEERHKRRRSSSPENRNIDTYKYELRRFLQEHANIQNVEDFWRFFEKYRNRQQGKTPEFNRSFLLNVEFTDKFSILFDRLPVLDKNGRKVMIRYEDFREFMLVIKIYNDFQQKTKFAKLKKLRKAQSELPIAQYKNEIIQKLEESRVLLIAGDTGCGKSTQVPQYVMEAGYKKIVCTQPRRIACISLSKRVAYETLTEFKSTVGYQIKFEKSKRADTAIIFMTEGLLLRQASEETTLNSYDVIILDEVHERHLFSDFLVGVMKCLLYKRNDFKLILMSATINLELFQNYFSEENVQVIQVPGRLYPIEINYRPIVKDPYERQKDKFNCTPYLQIIQMIDEKYPPNQKGDMLIFLNGFNEISKLADAVLEYSEHKKNWIVLPLHSTLSLEDQDKVFDYPPEGIRKCIISTNIAETSVTIDGIRFVIDSGKVNRMMYHTNGGVSKLSEMNISQDSAKQRMGRAGRTGPGVCFRLYSEEDYSKFEAFTPAEIHLVPLESLILYMISLGLNDITHFPFLEKPSAKSLEQAVEKLKFSGALGLDNDTLQLTPLGQALSTLPVDLTIGKMLILSTVFGKVNSVLALAALLSVQSPISQTAHKNLDAENLRKPLESSHGDPLTYLNFYKEWLNVKQSSTPISKHSNTESSRKWAKKRCLEEQRFYEVTKLLEQFRDILSEADLLTKELEPNLSSGERSIRHGELKNLKSMRYQMKQEDKTRRRKQLKYANFNEYDEEDDKSDIRDVEFRISNDFKKLQTLLEETSADSFKDVMLLKLILTSGLYPQVAVEDEHNSSKTVSERLFHTKSKNFLFLRPTSFFVTNPEILQLHNDDIEVPPPNYFSNRPISRKHQVLVYQSILETKKVYLMNCFRMPALQTLMLFGKRICTNSSFTKFVFDDFLSVDVPYYGQGKKLLKMSTALRQKWIKNLEKKLAKLETSEMNKKDVFYFIEDLISFMSTDVSYNIKRLLTADLKIIFKRESAFFQNEDPSFNPFDEDFTIVENQEFGGVNLTENIIYDCLIDEEWAWDLEETILGEAFVCEVCGAEIMGCSIFKRLQHEVKCKKMKDSEKEETDQSEGSQVVVKPNSKTFECEKCGQKLLLTPVDILKHKKSCN
ncbi:probable ATP-dependent RNA helicase DHX34 [Coccinella septempunctata]|uniref:probable ATP-dependent RNA helicase DHX34 n=1 Tax=Coccinella septempunctata TaxID=41139 RepID=UPI001D087172|nr:probable ATP-dependent RNA helicase DHX34 [Coccinella septempunctata]